MRHIHSEGIILHKKHYGEGHEFVFILSKELGKIKATAKGSKKIKSKFLGHLETLNICKLQLYQGPHSLLVTESSCLEAFDYDNLSPEHTEYALKLAKILDRTIIEAEKDIASYELVKKGIRDLKESQKPFISFIKTLTNLIAKLGHFTEFNKLCPNCMQNIGKDSPSYLSENRQVLCQNCISHKTKLQTIDSKYRNFLSYLNQITPEEVGKLKVNPSEQQTLLELTESYLHAHH